MASSWSYKNPNYASDEAAPQAAAAAAQTARPGEGSGGARRWVRRLAVVLAVFGLLLLGYAALVYFYGDPITSLYTDWRQRQMSGQLDREFREFRPPVPLAKPDAPRQEPPLRAAIRAAALKYARQVEIGDPVGRIEIARIGVSKIVVNGTGTEDLRRGPGRYPEGSWPGLGKVSAIAGHRTTFGAPFRRIDALEKGNLIRLELPYGTFTYRVFAHEIVDSSDWSILGKRGFDMLVLSACHPLYNASQRWIVFARLVKVAAPARGK